MGSCSAPFPTAPLLRQQLLPLDAGLVVGCNSLPERPLLKRLEHVLNQLGVCNSTVLLNLAGLVPEPLFRGWDLPTFIFRHKPEIFAEFTCEVADLLLRAPSLLEYGCGVQEFICSVWVLGEFFPELGCCPAWQDGHHDSNDAGISDWCVPLASSRKLEARAGQPQVGIPLANTAE